MDPSSSSSTHHGGYMTASQKQARALEKLLAHPEREVKLPNGPKEKTLRAPREMMKNVTGSSAGAGSGEFHVYKHARRREYERIKMMEDEAAKEKAMTEFERQQAEQAAAAEAKTSKNRAKRDKKKAARAAAIAREAAESGKGVEGLEGGGNKKRTGGDGSGDGEDEQGNKKRKVMAAPGVEKVVFQRPDSEDEEGG